MKKKINSLKLGKRKSKTHPQLIKEADKVFSIWVRSSRADKYGYLHCFTCNKRMHWKESEAGHYIKRGHHQARYDERNVWPQCPRCNKWLNGNQDEYALHLVRIYGKEILFELSKLKNTVQKISRSELTQIIEIYKQKVKELGG